MKRLFVLAVAALTLFAAVSCNPEGSSEGEGNAKATDIVGHWNIFHEDGEEDIVINANGTLSGDFFGEGTWSLKDGVLTIKSKDYEGQDLTSWYKVDLLYEKSVLVLRWDQPATDEQGHNLGTNNGEGEVYFFFRDGKAKANDIKDIQGKWYWFMQRDESFVRGSITVKGTDADVIIAVWGERYKGTAEYKDGRIKVNVTSCYTSRYDNTDFVTLEEYQAHPENAPWLDVTNNSEEYSMSNIPIDWPFIANGKEAYCILANLPAVFILQK